MVVLFDQYNLPENIYEVIFATKQQVLVAKLLIEEMKKNDGGMGKTEMSMFATKLHEGATLSGSSGPVPVKKETKINFYIVIIFLSSSETFKCSFVKRFFEVV